MRFRPHGILPAMITPIDKNGKVDEKALRRLVDFEIEGGLHGVFAFGTTGEFYGFSLDEYRETLGIVIDQTRGRVPVYAGASGITTRECIALAQEAQKAGVDALSVLTPYFITINQKEIKQHYETIAANTDLPIILYDNAPKTHLTIKPDTVAALAKVKNIVGIKDSTGDLTNTADIILKTKDDDFSVMMGRDSLIYANVCYGGSGAVAACANVAPRLCADIYDKYMAGDLAGALEAQYKLVPLRLAFTLGSFPTVIKEALDLIGVPSGACLPPIGPMTDEERAKLKSILLGMGLIK